MQNLYAATLAFGTFFGSLTQAQDINASLDLSLSQAIKLAVENTENLDAPRARIESIRTRLSTIGKLPTPELRIRHNDGRLARESSLEYALRFRLNNPWETKAMEEEGLAQSEVARIQLKLAEQLLVNQVKHLYFDTLFRQEDSILARKIAEAQTSIRKAHDNLLAAKSLTLPKALESRLKASKQITEATEAKRNYEKVTSFFLALLAQPEGTSLNLLTSFSTPNGNTSALTIKNLFSYAVPKHSKLHELERKSDAARARIHQAEARRIPWFSFLQGSIENDRRISSDSNQWGVLLGIEIPMWGHRADIQAATAELHENLAIQRLARRNLRLTLSSALHDYRTALQRLNKSETSFGNLEAELTPALEKAGIDLVSQNRLRIGLLEARRDLLETRRKFQSALLALEEILGQPIRSIE